MSEITLQIIWQIVCVLVALFCGALVGARWQRDKMLRDYNETDFALHMAKVQARIDKAHAKETL